NEAQRMLLAARDGGCIGCRATVEESEGHHIRFWRNGGLTLIPNLALLCHTCHDLVHEHDFEVHTPAGGKPELRPPEHLHRPNPPPPTNPIQRN
ncbi:MAG: HNH endonuclease, partial [bacterium]|nr:HNH endonuclease [bacterium]